jgi:hypothetical protein
MSLTPRANFSQVVRAAIAETTVNGNNDRADALIQLAVKNRTTTSPPGSPAAGDCYVVATGGSGAWTGHDGKIAAYYNGWLFFTPIEGWHIWVDDEDVLLLYDGSSWVSPSPTATNFSGYGTGSAYTLTSTPAAITMGTTSPTISITKPGTYLILANVTFTTNGTNSDYTFTAKLRRTNNTAADIANGATSMVSSIPSALGSEGHGYPIALPFVLYTTANSNDALTIFASVTAGTVLQITSASLVAIRLY